MQAIRTRYYGPTNTHGSRIVARCGAGIHTMVYEQGNSITGNHGCAAQMLAAKLGWTKEQGYAGMLGGCFGNDWYWVFNSPMSPFTQAFDTTEVT